MKTDYMGYKKSGGTMPREMWELIQSYKHKGTQAQKANKERYEKGLGIWEDVVGQYAPGGDFGQGAMASYQRSKTRDLAQASQSLVSAGLYNSTIAANMPKKYEEEVGTPFRLNLEDIRQQRLGEARAGMAGFIERREDIPPDPTLLAALLQKGASAGGFGGTGTEDTTARISKIFGPSDMFGRGAGSSRSSGGGGGLNSGGGGGYGGGGGRSGGGGYGGGGFGQGGTGSGEPETVSDFLDTVKAMQAGWTNPFYKGSGTNKLFWDEDKQQWRRTWGGGEKKYGSAEQTYYTSWLTPEQAAEEVRKGLQAQIDIARKNKEDVDISNIWKEASGGWL